MGKHRLCYKYSPVCEYKGEDMINTTALKVISSNSHLTFSPKIFLLVNTIFAILKPFHLNILWRNLQHFISSLLRMATESLLFFSSLFCFWIQLFITAATFCQVFAKREKIYKNRNLHSKVLGETKQCTKPSGVRKGQCHDIFTPPGPPSQRVKIFSILVQFC